MTKIALVLLLLFGATDFVRCLDIHPRIFDSHRKEDLLSKYALKHYGSDSISLIDPQMIVVHETETKDFQSAIEAFQSDILTDRPDLHDDESVNVGIHFLIDNDGTIYQLTPLELMARHVIGFNYTAIGIENVGRGEKDLTAAQVMSNAKLIAWIIEQRPTIMYLIGHYEYQRKELPHFKLYKELDTSYSLTSKADPGPKFMKALRGTLRKDYSLTFLD